VEEESNLVLSTDYRLEFSTQSSTTSGNPARGFEKLMRAFAAADFPHRVTVRELVQLARADLKRAGIPAPSVAVFAIQSEDGLRRRLGKEQTAQKAISKMAWQGTLWSDPDVVAFVIQLRSGDTSSDEGAGVGPHQRAAFRFLATAIAPELPDALAKQLPYPAITVPPGASPELEAAARGAARLTQVLSTIGIGPWTMLPDWHPADSQVQLNAMFQALKNRPFWGEDNVRTLFALAKADRKFALVYADKRARSPISRLFDDHVTAEKLLRYLTQLPPDQLPLALR
jgi:hypothetical protein